MGVEQVFPIGTVLTRLDALGDEWDSVRVVGAGSELMITSNTDFTETRPLSVVAAREDYESDLPSQVEESEEGRVILVNPGLTPEQLFAEQARADRKAGIEPQGRQGRKRSAPPAPVRQGGE